jgi:glycosyltransferase involved in cell wall biosynthesis
MLVRLFHTLASEGRTSMEVYARQLAAALPGVANGLTVDHWRVSGRLRGAASRLGPLAPLAGYVDRYGLYQWCVRGKDADVNHVVDHGYGHLGFSLNPRRTVVTFHDAVLLKLEARELPTDTYPRISILGHKLSLRAITRVARVITPSESSRSDFLRFTDYRPDQVRVVPQGVSDQFRPLGDADDGTRSREPVRLLHVGHCGPYKNIEGILRALPRIRRRLAAPVVLTKVGGQFNPGQRALIRQLGIDDAVHHVGAIPLDDLVRTYARGDVLLTPSLYEGFGMTALEAMACGTPVVASNVGSLPDVVGDAGLLVPPTDIEAIADAVVRVVTDRELRDTLRQRGLERARSFTWERTARETLAVYREIHEENC